MTLKSTINRPLELSLRLFGIWPNSSYPILKGVTWTTLILVFLAFQYWYCITHIKSNNLLDLLDGLSVTISNTLLLLKLCIIWFHNRTFCDILAIMFEDWGSYASTGENKHILMNNATLSSRISNFLIGYYLVTFVVYSGISLLMFGKGNSGSVSEATKLIIRMEFPFEFTTSPLYETILIIQFLFEGLIVLAAATAIALIATLILHVGCQIDIFCQRLMEISGYSGKEVSQNLIITDVVFRHQRILHFSNNIERMFTYISLGQFLSNMAVIGFISFVLAVSLNTEQGSVIIIKIFPYFIAINCEAFILCYTGEYLSAKGENIAEVIYNFLWYELNPREARIILLVILRSQKQLTLTAGKFVTLSLEAFANMLKASASYVSVLLAMY